MEIKKTPKADLEGKKSMWMLIGYVMVLAIMFVAFEWTERDKVIDTSQALSEVVFEEEIIPITQPETAPPPPPPPAPAIAEVLEIVEDDVEIEEVEMQTSEDTNEPVTNITYNGPFGDGDADAAPVEETIFEVVENMPEFPGGNAALMKFLSEKIKYPTIAQENGTQGRVIIQFVVNRDGSVVDPVVVRSVDPYLDKEALRVIGLMPKWKPGMQRGKPVRVKYTVPVMFRLQ